MNARDARNAILVVDDEPQVLAAIEDTLEGEFKVLPRKSARAALKVLESEQDLAAILSDQRMPGMTGDELFARAMGVSDATRVLITGYADLDAVIRAVNLGKIFGYISKPWDPEQLKLVIYKAVEYYRLRRELTEEQRLLRNLMDNIPDGIFFKDLEHRFVRINNAQARRLSLRSPTDAIGRRARDILPSERVEPIEETDSEVLKSGVTVMDRIYKVEEKPERVRWYSVTKAPVHNEKGKIVSLVGIARDITERKEAEEKIKRLNRVYAVLSGINSLIVRVRDRQELFREACRIAVEQGEFAVAWIGTLDSDTQDEIPVAWAGEDAESLATIKVSSPSGFPGSEGIIGRALREGKPVFSNDLAAEPRVGAPRRNEAVRRGYRSLIALALVVNGTIVGHLSMFAREPHFFTSEEVKLLTELAADISFALEYIKREEELNYLAYYDALTGLPNRALFNDRLNQVLHAARQCQGQVAVVLADVMRLRLVNTTLGRHAGDALLREFAGRLKRSWSDPDNVARVAGDNFAGMIADIREAPNVAHQIERAMTGVIGSPFTIEGKELKVAVTTGAALFPSDGEDAETLFRNAEAALRKAKDLGESNLFYQPEMNARVAETLLLENKMRRALDEQQFVLHYQPKVDLTKGTIIGLEALIRWNDPETGLVPPMQFIPLLEETGMILEAGRWAMRNALEDYRQWHIQGLQPSRIAVNVSPVQLRQKNFVDVVREAIKESTAGSPGLDLEITESLIMQDIEGNIEKLRAIRDMGVNIAIDDFGTGYSSLGYLTRLPVNALKIDRSFIVTMASSPDSMSIVSTIISLAHSLNLKVIAEGVDSEEQRKILRLLKCDEIQGYLVSRPVPASEIEAMLGEQREK